jgi:hypothetical protein
MHINARRADKGFDDREQKAQRPDLLVLRLGQPTSGEEEHMVGLQGRPSRLDYDEFENEFRTSNTL